MAMCSGRTKRVRLSFPVSFSLVHFFWRSKRNEHNPKNNKRCPFKTPLLRDPEGTVRYPRASAYPAHELVTPFLGSNPPTLLFSSLRVIKKAPFSALLRDPEGTVRYPRASAYPAHELVTPFLGSNPPTLLFSSLRVIKKAPFSALLRDPEGTQTPNLLIRSQMLYSVKLRDHYFCERKYSKILKTVFNR